VNPEELRRYANEKKKVTVLLSTGKEMHGQIDVSSDGRTLFVETSWSPGSAAIAVAHVVGVIPC